MGRLCIGIAGLLLTVAPAAADGRDLDTARGGCGGDAYSVAEVGLLNRERHRNGPIVVVPDTLCADVASTHTTRIDSLNLYLGGNGGAQPPTGSSGSPLPRFRPF